MMYGACAKERVLCHDWNLCVHGMRCVVCDVWCLRKRMSVAS